MASVLLIDDDEELTELLVSYLGAEGFEVAVAHDGPTGLERASSEDHEMVVLDVMLPGMNGFDVLRELRQRSRVPVLMLTARGEDVDRIVGLELGADDYLAKPFNPRELVARIRAVRRRIDPPDETPKALSVGEVTIDPAAHAVTLHGEELALTTSEYAVLEVLLRHAGTVVSRETLSQEALGRRYSPLDRSIDVHVSNLRRKLGSDAIRTVRGAGYLYALR
ncbi:MAG: response regulator transcription factor [Deltaproteobacteria bacterium]|nr:response regulator transcription factor [Deltaproteobacteria bacterium]